MGNSRDVTPASSRQDAGATQTLLRGAVCHYCHRHVKPCHYSPGATPKDRHEKRYCRQRWTVERRFAWLNNYRRLDRFLEESQKSYRVFVRVFFVKPYSDLL